MIGWWVYTQLNFMDIIVWHLLRQKIVLFFIFKCVNSEEPHLQQHQFNMSGIEIE